MSSYSIKPVSKALQERLQDKIDQKTKPLGALGQLEEIALKIGLIQNSLKPQLNNPHIVVFAADHGIAQEGVSAYPQEVTYQMVMNFLSGGAAINVFCRQNFINIKVVDAGVNYDFPSDLNVINAKVDYGTQNFLKSHAMTTEQCKQAMKKGADLVDKIHHQGCNIIGFGEMGIGNTSSASMIMSALCDVPIEDCVGRGAGLTDEQYKKKIGILQAAQTSHFVEPNDTFDLLRTFGGFEIVMMCGAMLQAASHKMVLLVDGFISSSAFLAAYKIEPNVLDYAIFCHQSQEQAHAKMLSYFEAKPLINLNMRLGEGTGAAVAFPIIQSAVRFLNEMASFERAGVSEKV